MMVIGFMIGRVIFSLQNMGVLRNDTNHVTGAGRNAGLYLMIDVGKNHYVSYVRAFYGIQILVHEPNDFPETSLTTVVGQPGSDVILFVTPSIIASDPAVRSLEVTRRNCLFNDEVHCGFCPEHIPSVSLISTESTPNNRPIQFRVLHDRVHGQDNH